MEKKKGSWRGRISVSGLVVLLGAVLAFTTVMIQVSQASGFRFWPWRRGGWHHGGGNVGYVPNDLQLSGPPGGTWYWMRSPEQEKRVVMGLYNRYCIRCHGVDGRGVWDIPCVPNFANPVWQSSRSDGQLARAILEGRGAVMPPFRGTLTLEEAWAMSHYLRTFVPGTEASRPDFGPAGKLPQPKMSPPKK